MSSLEDQAAEAVRVALEHARTVADANSKDAASASADNTRSTQRKIKPNETVVIRKRRRPRGKK